MHGNLQTGLNKYLANAGIMYIKIHNLHWNVVGEGFKQVHEYMETIYDGFAEIIDETAELIKIRGGFPAASLKEYLELATIKEIESKDYSVKEVFSIVKADIETLKKQALEIREIASKEDDFYVVGVLEENLKSYDKTLWFIGSMLK